MLENYDNEDNITVEELVKLVRVLIFQLAGSSLAEEGINQAYSTGRGKIIVRGRTHIGDNPHNPGRYDIIITEIPLPG